MFTGVQHVRGGQAERVNRTVRDLHRTDKGRVDRRFQTTREFGVDDVSLNPCCAAGGHKGWLKCEIVFGKRNEQTVGRFNAVAGNASEDLVFSNAFPRGFGVGHRVTGTTV